MAEPLILQITAEDLASAVLGRLQGEVARLGTAAGGASSGGLAALTGATGRLTAQTTAGTGSIQGWKLAQEQAGKAAAASTPQVTGLGAGAEKASGGFLSGAKSGLAFAGALTGLQLGLGLVGNVLQATVGHVVGFQSAMANVNTLGANSVAVQAKLREELLKLPAALGDSVTLAKGLYDVLSAGVAPAEAVAFLATSASLAKAGLADLGTTTEALTKTMAAFQIPTELASQVADVLFKTVDIGQGNLQAFARAMPTVTQMSASMGLSLTDTTATLATLTQTFKNADTAATGYRSLLTQLIQNSDKFASAGVNITKVAGEQGMVGVLRVLQELTGGNSEKMKLYVNDTEGLAAAMALTGPQFQLLLDNLDKTRDSLGTVSKGIKIQQATASEAWKAMVAEAGKTADNVASPFLRAFVAIAQGATAYAAAVNRSLAGIQAPSSGADMAQTKAMTAAMKEQGDQLKTTSGLWASLGNILNIVALAQSHEQTVMQKSIANEFAFTDATERTIAALKIETDAATDASMTVAELNKQLLENKGSSTEASKASQQLTNDLAGLALTAANFKPGALKIIDPEDAKRSVDAAIVQFGRIEASGKVSFAAILAQAKDMLEGIRDQMGVSSPVTLAFKAMVEDMERRSREVAGAIPIAFAEANLKTKVELNKTATDALASFKVILDSGQATPAQIVTAWEAATKDITDAGLKTLPPGFEALMAQVKEIFRKAGVELPKPFRDAFGNMVVDIKKILPGGYQDTFNEVLRISRAFGADWEAAMSPALRNAAERFGLVRKATDDLNYSTVGLTETARMLGHAFNAAGVEVNAYGNAIARTSEETRILNGLKIDVFEKFASDVPGLLEQLARVRKEIGAIGGGAGAGTPEAQSQLTGLRAELAAIQEKLAALGVDQFGQALAGAATTATSALAQTTAQVDTLASSTARLTTQTTAAASAAASLAGASRAGRGGSAGTLDPIKSGLEAELRQLQQQVLNDKRAGAQAEAADAQRAARIATLKEEVAAMAALAATAAGGAQLAQLDAVTSALKTELLQLEQIQETQRKGIALESVQQIERRKRIATLEAEVDALAAIAAATAVATAGYGAMSQAVGGLAASYGTLKRASDFAPGGQLPGGGDFAPGGQRDRARPLPLRPGASPGTPRPPGWNSPGRPPLQRFAGGGIVQGSGGVDSQLILATPGERVSTPGQQGQDRAVSITFAAGAITIQVGAQAGRDPVEMGDIAAQAFVRALAPRLNESLRRGGGERFA